ncbi:hypothetical protein [Streptomyces sp. NPDC086835]|uniref:hypothetical protein n=1 Tax=Streptomyces sp. NPDC086835 TaxID=3365761 RepID=UPI00380BDD34
MSALILAAMAACFVLLVASVVAYRHSTAVLEPDHAEDCQHCAVLRHPSQRAAFVALSSLPHAREGQ